MRRKIFPGKFYDLNFSGKFSSLDGSDENVPEKIKSENFSGKFSASHHYQQWTVGAGKLHATLYFKNISPLTRTYSVLVTLSVSVSLLSLSALLTCTNNTWVT
jgi:hypothetical protein